VEVSAYGPWSGPSLDLVDKEFMSIPFMGTPWLLPVPNVAILVEPMPNWTRAA
jgi:hypothetical protein